LQANADYPMAEHKVKTKENENMPDLDDSQDSARKHKVIHWNPENDDGTDKTNATKTRAIIIGVSIIVAVVLAAGGSFIWKNIQDEAKTLAASMGVIDPEKEPQGNIQEVYQLRSRADMLAEIVGKKMREIRSTKTNHPILTNQLIAIETENLKAEDFMGRYAYGNAYRQYTEVEAMIETFAGEVESKLASQQMYDNFLSRIEELKIGDSLAPDAYDNAFAAASGGKQFLDEGSFSAARRKLDEATSYMDELEGAIAGYIQQNSALGRQQIAQGNGDEAIAAFTNVLNYDPGNEDAINQIERAKVANQVYSLLIVAKQKEERSDLEGALESYEKAFAIDDQSTKAQQGISRARREIEIRDFNIALNDAQDNEANGKYLRAIDSYRAAIAIFPTRTDLEDAIVRVQQEKRQNDIVTMVTAAYDFEREYDWESSRTIYMELVDMEPELKEAKDGLLRTGKMIRSIMRYEKLLEIAVQEAQVDEFQTSIRTFDEAMKAKPAYLALSEEGERLRRFLQLQSTPIPVTIISDDNTWVSIQGPTTRKPRKLKEDTYQILPGRYTFTGRKKDYMDVKKEYNIRGGQAPMTLTIIANQRR